MSNYETGILILQSITILVSILGAIITYSAIVSSRKENFFVSTLDLINSFFTRVDNMNSNYQKVRGTKLFVHYEQDIHLLLFRFEEFYRGQILLQSGSPDVVDLLKQLKGNSGQKIIETYVEQNGAELVHYLVFFSDFLPSILDRLNPNQQDLICHSIRSQVTMSEWKVLSYYAQVKKLSHLTSILKKMAPEEVLCSTKIPNP